MESVFSPLTFWHWFALAAILGILDVALGANFLFIWCGLCAAMVGLLVLFFPSLLWEYQLLIFSLAVLASLIIWRQYLKTYPKKASTLNRRSALYIGRVFTLDSPIENGRGKIKVDDTTWRIESKEDIPAGIKVRVMDVDGVILKVEKA